MKHIFTLVVICLSAILLVAGCQDNSVSPEPETVLGHPTLGSKDAPVTLTMYMDFQYSYCADFVYQALPQIEMNYVLHGKVKIVFMDYPLVGIHDKAFAAAEAAWCAHEQDRFWDYLGKLFDNIYDWQWRDKPEEAFGRYAAELGLNVIQFNKSLSSGKYKNRVEESYSRAISLGLSEVPSFFVNNEKIVGAQDYYVFKAAIDKALGK